MSDDTPLTEPLDDGVKRLLDSPQFRTLPPWHSLDVEAARRLEDELFGGEPTTLLPDVIDSAIPGPQGSIPIRLYRGRESDDLPVLLFCHGGGWTLGTLDSADDICRELAHRIGCLVVSVDYRLAPEEPFPAGLVDSIAALEWVYAHADAIGGRSDQIGVAGTSAGGNLAAALARWDREHGPGGVSQQVLCYPIVDDDFETPSYREHADGPLLTRADMEWFWDQYLRHPVDRANPYARPLQATDLEGLPPAVVLTCGHDVLRDEGIAYARALEQASVDVVHTHCPRLPHGGLSLTESVTRADTVMNELTDVIRSRFANTP